MLDKILRGAVAVAMGVAMTLPVAGYVSAEEAQAAEAVTTAAPKLDYVYTSKEYGYTINCPQKPQVIAAKDLYPDKKGEILIFANEGYTITRAWVVLTDAFDTTKVPDYNTMTSEEAKKYLTDLVAANGYEGAMVVNLSKTNKAVYVVTAKEMTVDTDGDGQVDATVTASAQNVLTFFRMPSGKCYTMILIDNPELTDPAIEAFQQGLCSFAEAKN